MKTRIFALLLSAVLLLAAQEPVDLSIVHRIKTEAFENSKVMDHLFYLTDVHGPRLTGLAGPSLLRRMGRQAAQR